MTNLPEPRGGRTGRVEFIAACRRMAIEDGTTLEAALWEGLKAILIDIRDNADLDKLERVLKWVARFERDGMVPQEGKGDGGAPVQVNVGVAGTGPQFPPQLDAYFDELEELERQHRSKRIEITRDDDIDDVLS